ncbi:hypothetical protein F8388_020070 [Cannabis sativa]|uniref:Uncharacterized protein n=1 Tax=Cannabis sativa TaxID=3483 RepID=A0A7J6F7Y2_CANSA|nr:hypothetical protein F8388_020070 [Cannabis sativa]
MKLQAEAVHSTTSGIPNSRAASIPKVIIPSVTIQVTGGTSQQLLSLCKSFLNGPKQFFLVESHNDGISWVASRSDGGKPSADISRRSHHHYPPQLVTTITTNPHNCPPSPPMSKQLHTITTVETTTAHHHYYRHLHPDSNTTP